MTIAVDLVATGVTEPVRFIVETKAKIFPSGEKFFWSPSKPKFHETYIMELKEVRAEYSCLWLTNKYHLGPYIYFRLPVLLLNCKRSEDESRMSLWHITKKK